MNGGSQWLLSIFSELRNHEIVHSHEHGTEESKMHISRVCVPWVCIYAIKFQHCHINNGNIIIYRMCWTSLDAGF